jgi:hypothetical protein
MICRMRTWPEGSGEVSGRLRRLHPGGRTVTTTGAGSSATGSAAHRCAACTRCPAAVWRSSPPRSGRPADDPSRQHTCADRSHTSADGSHRTAGMDQKQTGKGCRAARESCRQSGLGYYSGGMGSDRPDGVRNRPRDQESGRRRFPVEHIWRSAEVVGRRREAG